MNQALAAVSANIRVAWVLLKEAFFAYMQDNASSMGAALTFYAVLSLAPSLIVATAIAGLGLWQEVAQGAVLRQLEALVGETSVRVIQAAILSASRSALGTIASTIGVLMILGGASGAFIELQDALNKIWRVERRQKNVLLSAIRQRALSFCLVLVTGALLLFSLVSSAALVAAEDAVGHLLPWPVFIFGAVDVLFWFAAITLLLAAIFKLLPDTEIVWNDVWIGAAIASLLFTTGKVLMGVYLAGAAVSSAYGAASSPLVVLVWMYYSAQIVLFGAEIAHVYGTKHRSQPERSCSAAKWVKVDAKSTRIVSAFHEPMDR